MENRGNRNPSLANRKADRQRRGETKLAKTGNAQAKKLALVAVLLVVLIAALLTQPESETAESLEDLVQISIVSLKNSQPPVQAPSLPELPEELLSVAEFSAVDLDLARASSAFAFKNRLAPTPSAVVPSKVNAIYGSSDRRSAVIAKQVIRQGEKMNDGRTVIEINDAGAVIQP